MNCKVAIIGAGVAGVTAASFLSKAGIDNVHVFESSDRCGGRLKHCKLDDNITVNLGANWMVGDKNPILALLKKNKNVKIFEDFKIEKTIRVLNDDFDDVTKEYRTLLKPFLDAHAILSEKVDPELISIEDALTRFTDYTRPSDYLYKALQYIDGFEALCGTPNNLTSVGDINEDALALEIGTGSFMTSNTEAVIPIIAADGGFQLDSIELNRTVSQIRKHENGFEIIFTDEKVVHAEYVICTVPISQYQQRKITIDFIPERWFELINSIPFVNYANCWVLLEHEDEESLDPNMFIYIPTSDSNPFRSVEVCHSVHHHFNRKVLLFRTMGDNAIQFNKMSREKIEESILYVLNKTLDVQPRILNISHPQWSQIDQFMGCYSNVAIHPGMTGPQFYAELVKPICEGFYVAGDAFDYHHAGYVTAAHKTATLAAHDIAKRVQK